MSCWWLSDSAVISWMRLTVFLFLLWEAYAAAGTALGFTHLFLVWHLPVSSLRKRPMCQECSLSPLNGAFVTGFLETPGHVKSQGSLNAAPLYFPKAPVSTTCWDMMSAEFPYALWKSALKRYIRRGPSRIYTQDRGNAASSQYLMCLQKTHIWLGAVLTIDDTSLFLFRVSIQSLRLLKLKQERRSLNKQISVLRLISGEESKNLQRGKSE